MTPSTTALARAFTRRNKRSQSNAGQSREGNGRYLPGTIDRNLISLPTELISTTNVNALSAPDISSLNASSSGASISSGNDSDFSNISRTFIDSPTTSPDTSSMEGSPVSHDPHNTVAFFDMMPRRSATTAGIRPSSSGSSSDAPAVPKRAISHSKKAHQELHRQRSISRMSPPPLNLSGASTSRASNDVFTGSQETSHPFGKELAQVNEVAEEFGLLGATLLEEEKQLLSKGLMKFGVEDYLDEIQGFSGGVYEGRLGPMANPWI